MTQRLVIVDSARDAPARIQIKLGKAIGRAASPTNWNFWGSAIVVRNADQQQITIALHYAQAVLHPQILITHPNRVAVGIGAASTNARKIKRC